MAKVAFPLVGDYRKNSDVLISGADTVNMFVMPNAPGFLPALVPTPGLAKVLSLPEGSVGRAIKVFNNHLYVVISQFVYRLDSALNYSVIGILGTNSGPIGISANNNNQLIFMDGSKGWIWNDKDNSWAQIVAAGFPGSPLSVAFLDSFTIASSGGTNQWQISDSNDATSWDPTQFQTMQSNPDKIVGIAVNKGQIFILGQYSCEVWFDAGAAPFPFVKDTIMTSQIGCAAVGSIAQGQDFLLWLGRNDNGVSSVMMSNGNVPQVVSTPEVDQAIATYDTVSDATAYIFKENGHTFYALNFTSANTSWLFDITTKMWSRQAMLDDSRHIAEAHAYFAGKHYVLAYNNSNIYEMNTQYLTNDDENIRHERVSPRFVQSDQRAMRVNSLTLDMVQGVGSANGTDKNPVVELLVSYDGGYSFGKIMKAPLGALGNTRNKTIFYNLGISTEFVFKVRCYNGTRFVVANAAINYDVVGN